MQDRQLKIETGERTLTFITAAGRGRIRRDLITPDLQAATWGADLPGGGGAGREVRQQFQFELTPNTSRLRSSAAHAAVRRGGGRQSGAASW